MRQSRATAMGRSKAVPTFFRSLGERLRMNFLLGSSIPTFLKQALILSFASLMVASGSPMISMEGSDLLLSASTVISCPSSPRLLKVLMRAIMVKKKDDKSELPYFYFFKNQVKVIVSLLSKKRLIPLVSSTAAATRFMIVLFFW